MKKWEAFSTIICEFIANGSPGYALIAFLTACLIPAVLVIAFLYFGMPDLAAQFADSSLGWLMTDG